MALPWRSFSESVTLIELFTASKITTTNIGTAYNVAYRELVDNHQWSARLAEALINTVDSYATGTVSVTQGSTTVLGVGTTFTTDMTGRYLRVGSVEAIFKITYVSATQLTLEKAWPFANAADQGFDLFQYLYSVDPSAGLVGQILLPSVEWAIREKSLYWVNKTDPARRRISNLTQAYILHGVDSTGSQVIEFWPRFTAARQVRIPYYIRVDDIAGSTKPIIPAEVIEALAASYCFSSLIAKFGAPEYSTERDHWEKVFEARLEAALQTDFDRHNTPDAVQDQIKTNRDYDYLTRHDI